MTDVKRWLGDEELKFYENILIDYEMCGDKKMFETFPIWHHKLALEALARTRACICQLLEAIENGSLSMAINTNTDFSLSNWMERAEAIDAEIAGLPRSA